MPQPNEAFFNSQPASAEIRRLTLIGIGSCIARLHGDESSPTTAELLGASGALRQWGVSEGMHVMPDSLSSEDEAAQKAALMSNPRLAAEFVAGQFLTLLQRAENLSGPEQAVLDEHDELDKEQRETDEGVVRMIDMEVVPDSVRGYGFQLGMLSMLMSMLDYTGERPHDESLAKGETYQHPHLNEG